jgi:hypothetical protein
VVVDDKTTEVGRLLSGALRPDGIAYLAGGRRVRTRARRAGLDVGPLLLELGELLVPVERDALRWALGTHAPSRRAALLRLLPTGVVGLAARRSVARRPHARPLAEWLHALGKGTSVVLSGETAFLIDHARSHGVEPGFLGYSEDSITVMTVMLKTTVTASAITSAKPPSSLFSLRASFIRSSRCYAGRWNRSARRRPSLRCS